MLYCAILVGWSRKTLIQERMLLAMRVAVQHLCTLAARLRLLNKCRTQKAFFKMKNSQLRLHVKVFAGHYLWRHAPVVANALPDMLAPQKIFDATFAGVQLGNACFKDNPRPPKRSYDQKREDFVNMKAVKQSVGHTEWENAAQALLMLARWLRMECINVHLKLILWDSAPKSQGRPVKKKDCDGEDTESDDEVPEEHQASHIDNSIVEDIAVAVGECNDSASADADVATVDIGPVSEEMPMTVQDILEFRRDEKAVGADEDEDAEAEAAQHREEKQPSSEELLKTELLVPYERRWWRAAPVQIKLFKFKCNWPGTDSKEKAQFWCAEGPVAKAVAKKTPRRYMWEAATEIFHWDRLRSLAAGTAEISPLLVHLKVLFDFWSPVLFKVRPHDVPMYRKPPPELFEHITFEEFRIQFLTFCKVLPQIMQQAQDEKGDEAKAKHGKAKVLEEADVFAAFMRQPYSWTKKHGIWHFLRLWMRLWVAGGSTEALAEMIGSYMTAQVGLAPILAPIKFPDRR
jgi:hypothetical protein